MAGPRGNRWERKPETRPDEILDAALEVFAVNGYRGTRLEQVAEAAGVTKGTIYHYFTSKDQLLLEAARRRRTRIFAETAAVIGDESEPASVRLRRLHHTGWHRWLNPQSRQIIRLMICDLSVEAPAVFREWLTDSFVRIVGIVSGLIEQGKASGEFRADADAEVAARMLVSGMMFQLLLHFEMGLDEVSPIDVDRLIDAALEMFLSGLKTGAVRPVPGCEAVGEWLETGLALLQRGALTGVMAGAAVTAAPRLTQDEEVVAVKPRAVGRRSPRRRV
jgi:AcrR family transcriptional regulator